MSDETDGTAAGKPAKRTAKSTRKTTEGRSAPKRTASGRKAASGGGQAAPSRRAGPGQQAAPAHEESGQQPGGGRETAGAQPAAPEQDVPEQTRQDTAERKHTVEAKAPSTAQVLRSAREAIEELTGLEAETVSSVSRGDDGGWTLHLEVVELRRIPDSVSMLGSYEMTLDADGELTGYRRLRRYERGKADPR